MKRLWIFVIATAVVLGMFICPAYSDLVTLYPIADNHVSSKYFDRNHGNGTIYQNSLQVADATGWLEGIYMSFLKFDLTSIPNNSVITSANLTLYRNSGYPENHAPFSVSLYHVQNDVSVTESMTWNTKPVSSTEKLDSQSIHWPGIGGPGYFRTWNLLKTGGLWNYSSDLSDTDNLVSLCLSKDTTTLGGAVFWAKEIGNPTVMPKLSIAYQVVPVPPTLWLLGSGLIGLVGLRRKFKK